MGRECILYLTDLGRVNDKQKSRIQKRLELVSGNTRGQDGWKEYVHG